MILDLDHFIQKEKPFWEELDRAVERCQQDDTVWTPAEARRLHYLFQRASSDLARVQTFAAEPQLRQYLEHLVGQAYAQLHAGRSSAPWFRPLWWLFGEFPRVFRRHLMAFWISLGISILGAIVGGAMLKVDPSNKDLLIPGQFSHLNSTPTERVQWEEENAEEMADHLAQGKATFSGQLMNNNIRVALKALAGGLTAGVFSVTSLFYNGVILGVIIGDYVSDHQSLFLTAWLLPHGVPELTAIFIGGQGGLVLAHALIGWGRREGLRARFRAVRGDLATLAGGLIVMLVYAGFVEAFLSQYHGPSLYWPKVAFGVAELAVMVSIFAFFGRKGDKLAA